MTAGATPEGAWGEAPGKLILAGEHAVVYGHLAVAGSVSLRTRVWLDRVDGPSHLGDSAVRDDRLWPALATVLPAEGVRVRIASELPVGCGMGSSAALAVAAVRARAALDGEALDFPTLHERAFRVERAFHGTPSGIDHAVCALGGLVAYRRTPEGPTFRHLRRPGGLPLVVVNTGTPGDTAAMVAGVRARGVEAELAAIGALAERVVAALEAGEPLAGLGPLLDDNHALLKTIGVSTPRLDAACADLRAAGAVGAKLAGAGGGGVAFGLVSPEGAPAVTAALRDGGWDAFALVLGG